MIELKKKEISHGDPEREAKTWTEKLVECTRLRSAYQDQQAAGLMTLEELSEKLEKLDETRKTAKRELRALENQQESIEELERDKEALLEYYAGIAPEALDSLTPEERHRLYKLARLQVIIQPNCDLEVRWVGELSLSLSKTERVQTVMFYSRQLEPAFLSGDFNNFTSGF